jgi:hypothetical protein
MSPRDLVYARSKEWRARRMDAATLVIEDDEAQ